MQTLTGMVLLDFLQFYVYVTDAEKLVDVKRLKLMIPKIGHIVAQDVLR